MMVEDGGEAWTILDAANPPPMAILGPDLPRVTGLELCRRIRAKRREPYTYLLLPGLSAGAD